MRKTLKSKHLKGFDEFKGFCRLAGQGQVELKGGCGDGESIDYSKLAWGVNSVNVLIGCGAQKSTQFKWCLSAGFHCGCVVVWCVDISVVTRERTMDPAQPSVLRSSAIHPSASVALCKTAATLPHPPCCSYPHTNSQSTATAPTSAHCHCTEKQHPAQTTTNHRPTHRENSVALLMVSEARTKC